jgi:outer membrane biogenesis lipoprotein LolB
MARHGLLFAAAAAAVLFGGCATTPPPDSKSVSQSQSNAAQKDEKYTRAGSHIPSKEPGRSVNDNVGDKLDVYNDYLRRPPPPTSN